MVTSYLVSHFLTVATAIVSTLMVIRLLATNRTPQSLLAWVLALVFVPLAAIPLYFLIGTRKFPRRAKRRMPAAAAAPPPRTGGAVARVLHAVGAPPVRDGHRFTLLDNGERAYAKLMQLVAGAQRSIDVDLFILGDDSTGWSFLEALCERARSGVRVRVVLDAVGSAGIARRAARELAAAGGSLHRFMPLLHAPLRGRTNLRCHRKLVVFDAEHVFVGGMNVADEYMGPTPRRGRWRDIAAVVSGPVALDATALFESDWTFSGGKDESKTVRAGEVGDAVVQLVPSGPDMVHDTFYNALLTAIFSANDHVAIVTPYYVPDDAVQRALVLAARRGVHTQLVMPARSNHPMADFARRGLLRGLAAAGVDLRFYPHGMVHAKAMVIDDSFAYVGSPNMDMRSFFLNYEDALFLYSKAHVLEVRAWKDALLEECSSERPHARHELWLFEQVARMLAPEL